MFDIHTTSQPQLYNKCGNKGGDRRARAEFIVYDYSFHVKFEYNNLKQSDYKPRHFKLNHTTYFSNYRGDGETPAVFLSSSLLGYVIRESIDIDEN